jgi:hypothetical protein
MTMSRSMGLRSGTRTSSKNAATGAVVAFMVDDIVSARAEVAAAGIELLGEIVWAGEGFGWFFLRAPDGNVY